MKVLFAVSNENITDAVIKQYQKEYKEIISYKNVYYFNAILKELQKDKSYDRIIVSEDLEPFANNNVDTIDKFLFEKLDSISDEAVGSNGDDTPIILIATDRRAKEDTMLVKYFGIGLYSAILGQDRSIEEVCKLINKPRTKKDAKQYYKIESDDVNYQPENESDVSETEIQNILAHYKRLGKNTERYVDSFNNIVSQYTDAQLRVIIKFLPLNVRAVLEAESEKYQEIMTFSRNGSKAKGILQNNEPKVKIDYKPQVQSKENKDNRFEDLDEMLTEKPKMTKPVVIPSSINTSNVTKLIKEEVKPIEEIKPIVIEDDIVVDELVEEKPKKGRGRPKKIVDTVIEEKPKKGRGRPKKVVEEDINLFELNDEKNEPEEDEINLFELDAEDKKEDVSLYELEQDDTSKYTAKPVTPVNTPQTVAMDKGPIKRSSNISSVLGKEKKIVSFVGTSKNGTSFIVNNLGLVLANLGVSTAILDLTTNKNAYYIYTKNDENLRKIAEESIEKLKSGIAEGIKVNGNLTVYTSLPGENRSIEEFEGVLYTLAQNYSVVLIDCDFNTPLNYFANSSEIYLVQSMDILTIQPLTAFLRDLKAKEILEQKRLKIILNKTAAVRGLTEKTIIGGLAYYNDPAMSFMTELFDRNTIKYIGIPFDIQTYENYLSTLVSCNVSLNGYSKYMLGKLNELANMVFPRLDAPKNTPKGGFTNSINSTLDKMKGKY